MMGRLRGVCGLSFCGALLACSTGAEDASRERELVALRGEVDALRAQAVARFEADTVLMDVVEGPDVIAVGLRLAAVRSMLSQAAAQYLSDVRLHLQLNEVVREGDVVRTGVGPLRVTAGRWDLAVTIQRVDARMRAQSIALAVTGANRIDVTVPIHVSDGTGNAIIDFRWDAATMTSIVCGDFAIREQFAGFVAPRTYQMRGYFELITEGTNLIARPVVRDRIAVSPQPTEESWERVRQILREQNRIFNCGIAVSPARMEQMLRDLLTRGFRFRLPSSILRPIPMPASMLNEVDVGGRSAAVAVRADPPRLTRDWLWLRATVNAATREEKPIRLDAAR